MQQGDVYTKKNATFVLQMKETLTYKIKQLATKAKESGDKNIKVTLTSGNTTSLNKI